MPHVLITTFGAVASRPRTVPLAPTVPAVLKKAEHKDVSARANPCARQTPIRDLVHTVCPAALSAKGDPTFTSQQGTSFNMAMCRETRCVSMFITYVNSY